MQESKKIVILGHFGVGKTSLIRRFVENSFSDKYKVTIGVHISKKAVTIKANQTISLILWDIEGTDDINAIREGYLLGTHGVFFVFDVSRPSTFQNIAEDLDLTSKKTNKTPTLIIGNKMDLANKKDVEQLLAENKIPYDFLMSAKTGDNVDEAFLKIAELVNTNA
jgi:small GTP-binding protein